MDMFGMGNSIKTLFEFAMTQARRTGRTTLMIENLKDGDRVIFLCEREAQRVKRLASLRGVNIETQTVPVKDVLTLFEQGTAEGRVVFDHTWLEEYYRQVLERETKYLDHLSRQLGGYGMAHVETKEKMTRLFFKDVL